MPFFFDVEQAKHDIRICLRRRSDAHKRHDCHRRVSLYQAGGPGATSAIISEDMPRDRQRVPVCFKPSHDNPATGRSR